MLLDYVFYKKKKNIDSTRGNIFNTTLCSFARIFLWKIFITVIFYLHFPITMGLCIEHKKTKCLKSSNSFRLWLRDSHARSLNEFMLTMMVGIMDI